MNVRNNIIDVDVSLSDPAWESDALSAEKLCVEAVTLALKSADLPEILDGRDIEVSVVLANDDLVLLNREYRDKDKPTNVLSLPYWILTIPLNGGPVAIGDIILAYQTIENEAREQEKFLKDHFTHLLVHGTLHLVGYDHMTEDDANIMETLEIRILEKMNIQNPYMEKTPVA